MDTSTTSATSAHNMKSKPTNEHVTHCADSGTPLYVARPVDASRVG